MSSETSEKVEHQNQTETETKPILEIKNISKHFGEVRAVDGVSLAIIPGEVHSIIGPNGAGKTTMFNLVTGTLRPTQGIVKFNGKDVTDLSLDERARLGMSRVFQSAETFPELTIKENMRLAMQATEQSLNPFKQKKAEHSHEANQLLKDMKFEQDFDTRVSNLSHGNKKRLEIGMALATDPEVLLLDEPTSGVSQEDSERIITQLKRMTTDTTVILVEHDIDIVMDISETITVLDNGQRIAQGVPEEIQNDQEVREAYLGGGA
jgi:branched-chain amino acid transport system ATP-binding protein